MKNSVSKESAGKVPGRMGLEESRRVRKLNVKLMLSGPEWT
jgi:hypothetical protein